VPFCVVENRLDHFNHFSSSDAGCGMTALAVRSCARKESARRELAYVISPDSVVGSINNDIAVAVPSELPGDFEGIPILGNQSSWFIAFQDRPLYDSPQLAAKTVFQPPSPSLIASRDASELPAIVAKTLDDSDDGPKMHSRTSREAPAVAPALSVELLFKLLFSATA
jgi:hypothetical protein